MKIVILLMSLFLISCAQMKTRKQLHAEKKSTIPITESSPATGDGAQDQAVVEREGTELVPKVGVILGPGGVKAFAHTGVIKEILAAKISIDRVIGIEWGALVAALYAQSGQIHEVEWKLYKLQEKDLPGKTLFSNRYDPIVVESFKSYLEKNLAGDVEQTKLRFSCPSLPLRGGKILWQQKGPLTAAVSKCLPYPPIFKPGKSKWMAAAFSIQDAIDEMVKSGIQVIIYVDVLGDGALLPPKEMLADYQSAIIWQELRRYSANFDFKQVEKVRVNTNAFELYDFANRSQLLSAGQSAGRKLVDQLVKKYNF